MRKTSVIKNLAFLEIIVCNFDRALDWYTKILGFKLSGEIVENQDGRWCRLETETGDKRLALWQPPSKSISDKHADSSFVPVFEVENLHALVVQLAIRGVSTLEDIRERAGYRITTIADPEGHKLQLFEVIV